MESFSLDKLDRMIIIIVIITFIESIGDCPILKTQMKVKIIHKEILCLLLARALFWGAKVHLLILIDFFSYFFLKCIRII